MDTASRVPAQGPTFDANQNAIHNEAAPNSTSNAGFGLPTTATNKTTTTGTTENAPGYLQQARETLASLAGTVQNAVGIDTPASTLHGIANNAKIDASMPSSEASGAKPGERVGGVGALPGDAKEEGVARLPDERTSVPSRELEGTFPGEKTSGVGALPGNFNESGVALLPDERNLQAKESIGASTHAAAHPSSENPDRRDLKAAAAHPIETAKAHPENPEKRDLKTAAAHPIETAKARRGSTSSSSSSEGEEAPGVPKKKTSLKNKLAGGMKTAMGKVKKDEEMIAEGQAQRGH